MPFSCENEADQRFARQKESMLKADYYNFEPSTETKRQCFFVRTSPYKVGGVVYPGLFSGIDNIHNFGKDQAMFFLVLLLESISLGFLIWAGDGSWMIWVGALVFVALDLFVTFLHHLAVAGRTKQLENELVVVDLNIRQGNNARLHEDGLESSKIAVAISSRKGKAKLIGAMLWLLAAVKIFTYYGIIGELNITTILICTFYLIVAFLHGRYTGYYWAARILKNRFHADQLAHIDGKGNFAQPYNERLTITEGMKEVSIESGHCIRKEVDTKGSEYYQLSTWGLLTDPQLASLVYKFDNVNTQKEVARKGLQLQLKIIGLPPSETNNAPLLNVAG